MKRSIPFIALLSSMLQAADYTYGMVGINSVLISVPSADIGVGYRKIGSHFAWDAVVGCDVGHSQLIYFQNSCLYYAKQANSVYGGLGLTVGTTNFDYRLFSTGRSRKNKWSPYINFPVTLGYQYQTDSAKSRFLQLQVTPLYTATLSYGFQF